MQPIFAHGATTPLILLLLVIFIGGPIVLITIAVEVVAWLRDRERSPFNGFTLVIFAIAAVAALLATPWFFSRFFD